MNFTEEVLLTLYAGHSFCQHWAEERKRQTDAWRERSYAFHLTLNNGEFNKMRHEDKKFKWICQHKEEELWLREI